MLNAMEEGPSVSVRAANYEFKGKIIALGCSVARAAGGGGSDRTAEPDSLTNVASNRPCLY